MSTWDEQAERDAGQKALRDEWAWNESHRTLDYPGWAAWARQQLAAASPAAAEVIAHGLPAEVKNWQMQEKARRQAEESRAERALIDSGIHRKLREFTVNSGGTFPRPPCMPAPHHI